MNNIRIELDRKWFEKNAESVTEFWLKMYPNEKETAKRCYIFDISSESLHMDDYDGKDTFSLNNYSEDKPDPPVYISIEYKPTAKEWGLLSGYLVKMFNKLKNIVESV